MDITTARLLEYTKQGYTISVQPRLDNSMFICVRKGNHGTQEAITYNSAEIGEVSFLTSVDRMIAEFKEAERNGVLD